MPRDVVYVLCCICKALLVGIVPNLLGNHIPENSMLQWIGNVIGTVKIAIGPKEVNFEKYLIDYHLLRIYLYVLSFWGSERECICFPTYTNDTSF